jgi:pimeloyl-ACP methyl ester carboxylesterase
LLRLRGNGGDVAERMIEVNGVELWTESFGDPSDPAVLLVMGVGASMLWWEEGFCRLLAAGCRFVIRYDHRDAGLSVTYEPGRPQHTGADLVADAVGVLDLYGIAVAHVVGVSAGGAPAAGPHFPQAVRGWLESWPVPFESCQAAIAFFGGDSLWARGWASGLETTADGLRPRFDVDVVVASLDEIATNSYWEDWSRVRTPSLVVRAENGVLREVALRMVEMQPYAHLVEIAQAKHDLHLDKPTEWRKAVETFFGVYGPDW